MPVKPRKNESKEEFISRCISEEVKNGHTQEQAIAMCYTKWEAKKSTKDIKQCGNQTSLRKK